MEIKSVCVIGGGLMGRQIGLNAAVYGYPSVVYDLVPEVCADVDVWADKYLAGRAQKGKMTQEEADKVRKLFRAEKDLEKAVAGADLIIEAIVEREDVKRNFFKQLDGIVNEDVIIATNSSYMVSSKFADCVKNPSRLANLHYYNPALIMKFVEVVQGPHTSTETAQALMDFCANTGKDAIWQKKEIDGFAGNYLIQGLNERAFYLVQNGYCTYKDVDIALEEGFNHRMGVFRMTDLVGVDLAFDIMKNTYKKTGVKPDMYDTFEQMVKEGRLGRKTGHGFYDYE